MPHYHIQTLWESFFVLSDTIADSLQLPMESEGRSLVDYGEDGGASGGPQMSNGRLRLSWSDAQRAEREQKEDGGSTKRQRSHGQHAIVQQRPRTGKESVSQVRAAWLVLCSALSHADTSAVVDAALGSPLLRLGSAACVFSSFGEFLDASAGIVPSQRERGLPGASSAGCAALCSVYE